MASPLQQNMNIRDVHDKYKLTNVIAGVDGCHFVFGQKPRGIPAGRTHIDFINRKGAYSINVQIVGGFDRRIYNILCQAPGSFHDAAIWGQSDALAWFRTEFPYKFILGDRAYPQSEFLMTPYSEREVRLDDMKALYNIRHSGAMVEMTDYLWHA